MDYLHHVFQVNKLTTTTETNLNILDNKIDAKTAELLAIIQVRFITFFESLNTSHLETSTILILIALCAWRVGSN